MERGMALKWRIEYWNTSYWLPKYIENACDLSEKRIKYLEKYLGEHVYVRVPC